MTKHQVLENLKSSFIKLREDFLSKYKACGSLLVEEKAGYHASYHAYKRSVELVEQAIKDADIENVYVFYTMNNTRYVIRADSDEDAERTYASYKCGQYSFIVFLGVDIGLSDEEYLDKDSNLNKDGFYGIK